MQTYLIMLLMFLKVVSNVFSNDEFDLSYVGANGKTNDPLFDNIKESRLKYHKSLIIAHININSLKRENNTPIDYFQDILLNHYIDLLFVSEIKLDESVVYKDLDCSPDFKLYRKDRYTNSGGLFAWIRSDIPQREMYELNFTSCTPHIESFLNLQLRKKNGK